MADTYDKCGTTWAGLRVAVLLPVSVIHHRVSQSPSGTTPRTQDDASKYILLLQLALLHGCTPACSGVCVYVAEKDKITLRMRIEA